MGAPPFRAAGDGGSRVGSDQSPANGPSAAAAQAPARHAALGQTKPGTLLKQHIPIQTERWSVTTPGFPEIELVSPSGDCADGAFLHSLNVTDIHTPWVETRAGMGKGQARVQQALAARRAALPFRLCGIESDNGSDFINHHLYRDCQAEDIQFTRGACFRICGCRPSSS